MDQDREADQGREFSAKAERGDDVHLVDAGVDAMIDPSPYRTRCGQRVLEVYNVTRKVTCSICTEADRPEP